VRSTHSSRISRLALVALVAVALSFVVSPVPAGAQPAGDASSEGLTARKVTAVNRVQGDKALSSRVASSDPALLKRTDSRPVSVVVKLDYDAVASYQGGVSGYAATSPSVTRRSLSGRSAAEQRYAAYAAGQEADFVSALRKRVPDAKVGRRLRIVYGGVAAVVPANKVPDILAMPDVVAVQRDSLAKPLTASSPEFIGANQLYPQLGGTKNAGKGVILGVLDTGAWPEHQSFADQGTLGAPPPKADGTPRTCDFGDNPLTPAVVDVFACNNKLIGGAAFLDGYLSDPDRAAAEPYHTARDSNGHGTHTGSTSAGNALASAPVFGVERGPLNGVAPGAWVSVYKVCGRQGCVSSDSAAAVEQAILDGVDVINFSISGGTSPFSDPAELAFLDAYAAGVFVSASAGNQGPGASTVNHLSPWVTTVAASTQRREFRSTLSLTAGNGDRATFTGASITKGAAPAPVVLAATAPGYLNVGCDKPAPAGLFRGKIVACQRGVNPRVEKGSNVMRGGAAGMVLYNAALADVETDNHWLPTVHLADGADFLAFMRSHNDVRGRMTAGAKADGRSDVMAAFSSRGPAGRFIKPDVTAPGVQILAGHTPKPDSVIGGPPGQDFQAIAGTSMSSPHTAGAAVLLRAVNPDWTPGQVKSALMTTATTAVVKENLTTPADPFDMGAGRIRVEVADVPGLTFDETAETMALFGDDPVNAVHLNVPSVNAPVMPGRLTTIRTAQNVSGLRQRYDVKVRAPAGSSITVVPSSFELDPGASVGLSITITSGGPSVRRFGEVRLVPRRAGYPQLHLPVAWIHRQGQVSLSSSCDQVRIPRGGVSDCTVIATNNSFDDTEVDLKTTVSEHLRVIGAKNAQVVNSRTAAKLNVPLAGGTPGTPSIFPLGSLDRYVPLADLGVTPDPIDDEELISYAGFGSFVYSGTSYDTVGVTSNGYLVAGWGSSEDIDCCNNVVLPDPAPPNNTLAPFWTDLDGSNDEGVRAAVVTDRDSEWLVIEWQVDVFGTDSNRHFQAWMGLGGAEDITFAYDHEAPPSSSGRPTVIGAENVNGTGGDTFEGPPAEDLRVASSAPTPGESVKYTGRVRGHSPGNGSATTTLDSPDIPGTTVVRSRVIVRP